MTARVGGLLRGSEVRRLRRVEKRVCVCVILINQKPSNRRERWDRSGSVLVIKADTARPSEGPGAMQNTVTRDDHGDNDDGDDGGW